MKIGNRFFDTQNHTYIMGILNITPDSFSDGGKWNHLDEALRHTEAMIADGADIIDIGGESTRPGHTPVSAEEEAQRVLPVIEAVRKRFDIPISVDTFKSSVAESAIQTGADLVNDIWGLKYDSEMGAVIAKYDVACCLMHNKSNTEYNNFLIDMLSETQECVNLARKAGIKDEKIILDPGVGFGKTFVLPQQRHRAPVSQSVQGCGRHHLYLYPQLSQSGGTDCPEYSCGDDRRKKGKPGHLLY